MKNKKNATLSEQFRNNMSKFIIITNKCMIVHFPDFFICT